MTRYCAFSLNIIICEKKKTRASDKHIFKTSLLKNNWYTTNHAYFKCITWWAYVCSHGTMRQSIWWTNPLPLKVHDFVIPLSCRSPTHYPQVTVYLLKWNHVVSFFHSVWSFRDSSISLCVNNLFFLLPSSIPLFYNLFIHLSANGHLDCFHFWTIKAVMNTSVQEFFGHIFPSLLSKFLGVEWLDYMVKCVLTY